ncbi:hypothetical protein [Hahella ganghwensis]|uniref:hypothetical protein n=1 Tax=Hahella ganghwensis TaxID=286420 RepID=UPI000376A256|nr:hypothetical protein [Hahella ganghwensis]
MGTEVTLSAEAKNAQADAMARLLDGGFIRFLTSADVLLATCALSATSAPAAVNGKLTFNAIADDSSADADGQAAKYETVKSDGLSVVTAGTVGSTGSGESLEMDETNLVSGGPVSVSSYTHQV